MTSKLELFENIVRENPLEANLYSLYKTIYEVISHRLHELLAKGTEEGFKMCEEAYLSAWVEGGLFEPETIKRNRINLACNLFERVRYSVTIPTKGEFKIVLSRHTFNKPISFINDGDLPPDLTCVSNNLLVLYPSAGKDGRPRFEESLSEPKHVLRAIKESEDIADSIFEDLKLAWESMESTKTIH